MHGPCIRLMSAGAALFRIVSVKKSERSEAAARIGDGVAEKKGATSMRLLAAPVHA
jgi:hypothetical protein